MKYLLSVILSCLISASAGAVTYVEGATDRIDTQLFTLDLGVNTITGTQTSTATIRDFDTFTFQVPKNQVLTGISIRLQPFPLPGTTNLQRSVSLSKCTTFATHCPQNLGFFPNMNMLDPALRNVDTPLFASLLPLVPGYYQLGNSILGRSGPGGSWDYTFTLTTAQSSIVPVPPALILLLNAMGGLGLVAVRRRKEV